MCGISGYISLQGKLDKQDFISATNTLNHRGPDAEGFYANENNTLYFGHKRLSIIDLSPASNQPFFSACGRYTMIYNGEVYNFREIKEQLQLNTRTTGDTEVILEAYIKIGPKAFELFNGMFAFAIYDIQERNIILCRDRIGIKPLFYYWDGNQFSFSSEIKLFKRLPGFINKINSAAIPEFLHLGFIPEPNTIYENVFKFPSAHYSIFNIDDIAKPGFQPDIHCYWNLKDAIEPVTKKDFASTKKELKALLIDSVEKQLISDVPVGTFLSGGIDSSLITAIAAQLKGDKIKTFSIGYDTKKYDESEYAMNVAERLQTEHYAFKLTEDEVEEILPSIIFQYDEPFADSSAYPTMIVSKLARQHVTVTLSGDGADELFLGYGMYQWASRLANPMVQALRKPFFIATQHASDTLKRGGLLLDYTSLDHIRSHIFSQEQYLNSEKDLKHLLLDENFCFDRFNKDIVSKKRPLTPKGKQSIWDIKYYLKDDLLIKVDRASMKYSLESRVPYLDHRVVEYAVNIDADLRYHKGISKYILKEILYDYLPRQLFNRPKWGFALPLPHWLKGRLNYLLDKYLNSTIINNYDILTNIYVQDLKDRFMAGEDYLYGRLWTIIILHWWLEENV
ncbi:MAG: asnB [Bacteroidota bacterium]|nr:asnB [Bacteroidota bacterium]